ncbi:hypothetical protein RIU76_08460 [Latilactobacillus sakei subsp. sakei]|uniref:hypothetical protein n=1 Tax=Latilactobacillus TaxID=2767885 RepID=UPI0005036693|nr:MULTISPECIES: hypothetical protein [Latilactobacillus]KGB14228.1 hypothetical protein KY41_08350 [Latilactobacillus sakei]MCS8582398.1 hypothetical protein [Latilactobacillus curvatus]MCS8606992.1 hypothetical protein [Latilactobacillus curvatus]MCS8617108.1 hypothetical protein [Latilactobacillus curvatus]MDR7924725.1 hypothetical protein [Latilactobacillus sakei subsp. sakei]
MIEIIIKSKTKEETTVKNIREITYYSPLGSKETDTIINKSDVLMNNWHGVTTFVGESSFIIDRKDIESIEVK